MDPGGGKCPTVCAALKAYVFQASESALERRCPVRLGNLGKYETFGQIWEYFKRFYPKRGKKFRKIAP